MWVLGASPQRGSAADGAGGAGGRCWLRVPSQPPTWGSATGPGCFPGKGSSVAQPRSAPDPRWHLCCRPPPGWVQSGPHSTPPSLEGGAVLGFLTLPITGRVLSPDRGGSKTPGKGEAGANSTRVARARGAAPTHPCSSRRPPFGFLLLSAGGPGCPLRPYLGVPLRSRSGGFSAS